MTDIQPTTSLPTTDATASSAAQTVGTIIGDGESVAETAIETAEPLLKTPVLKQLFELFMNYIFGQLGGALGTLTGYVVMSVQKYTALTNAATALAQLRAAQNSGDADAITQANSAADAAVAPILHYVGSIKS